MIPATPGFQGDGSYQLASDQGFQTGGVPVTGDLAVVVGLTGVTRFSVRPSFSGPLVPWTLPLTWAVEGDLAVVVALDARTAFQRPPPIRRQAPPARIGVRVGLDGAVAYRDYVREVVIPDDDEVLELLLAGDRR